MQITINLPDTTAEQYKKMAMLHSSDLTSEIQETLIGAIEKKIDPALEIEKYCFSGGGNTADNHDTILYENP